MTSLAVKSERTVVRRVFETWSIEMPGTFAETFVHEDGYWHAYDTHRSISLTSLTLIDDHGPVSADEIWRQMRAMLDGEAVEEMPPRVVGCAITADAPQSSRASRLLSGMLAAKGRLLIVTVTSDDLDWARRIWVSIRRHPEVPFRRANRSASPPWRSAGRAPAP